MKEFWVYTAMRVGLFVGSLAVVFGVWFLLADEVPLVWCIVIAFAISGVASYFLLERQREAFAVKVEGRADKVAEKLEESRSKEDRD